MALGHDRQQQMKKAKHAVKGTALSGGRKTETDAAQMNISAKSSDSELDSKKVTEMLDSITGGLADVHISQSQDRHDIVEPVVDKDSNTQVANNVDIITKSARKRAATKNKKRTLLANSESLPAEAGLPAIPVSNSESVELQNSQQDDSQSSQSKPVSNSKKTKQKFSKEEKAEYRARKEKSILHRQETSENVQPSKKVNVTSTNPPQNPPLALSKNKAKKKKHLKQDSEPSTPGLSTSTTDHAEHPKRVQPELPAESQTDLPVSTSLLPHDLNTTSLTNTPKPPATSNHNRHKSMDVRLRLNGQQHKMLSIDSPRDAPSSPSKVLEKQPLKIKLPGRDVTFVYPDELTRGFSRSSRGRSHATSISSQFSGHSTRGGHEMRSRQSSHTTVGTNGALENKLQSMILSHATDPAASTSTTSLMSEPATRSSRCLSPLEVQTSRHSAPPMEFAVSGDQQLLNAQSAEHDLTAREVSDNFSMAIPAVPTVFEARASQLHAPPSLGPPQPQNLPEQIPKPYQGSHSSHPSSHYNSNYPPQNPYYNNYYAMPPQMYNPYPMASPGLQMPFYDQPMSNNGMVYYNPDGSQVYPQEYYQYPPLFMNPYQQQHYEY